MVSLNQKDRRAMSKIIAALTSGYHAGLGQTFAQVENVLNENNVRIPEAESGLIFCGEQGRESFVLEHDAKGCLDNMLVWSWYRMPSGRYEITAYIS